MTDYINHMMNLSLTMHNKEKEEVMKAIRDNFKKPEPQPEPEEDNWDEFLLDDTGSDMKAWGEQKIDDLMNPTKGENNGQVINYLLDPRGIAFTEPVAMKVKQTMRFGLESMYKTADGEDLIPSNKCGCLFTKDGKVIVRVNGCTRITRKEGVNICVEYLRNNWVQNPMWKPRPVYEDKFLELLTERLNDHLFLDDWDGVLTPEIKNEIIEELGRFTLSDDYQDLINEWYTLENYFTTTITVNLKENQ